MTIGLKKNSYPRQIRLFKDRNNYPGLNHFQGVSRFMVWRFLFVCVQNKCGLRLASLIPPYQGFSCENMRCQFASGLSCGPRRPMIASTVEPEDDFRIAADYLFYSKLPYEILSFIVVPKCCTRS